MSSIFFNKYDKYIRPLLTFIFFTISFLRVSGQISQIDSLKAQLGNIQPDTTRVKLLYAIGREYVGASPEKGTLFAERALALAKKINFSKGIAEAYNTLGVNYAVTGDYTSALNYFEESLSISSSLSDSQGIANIYNNMGRIYNQIGDYDRAIESHEKSLTVEKSLGNRIGMAKSYNNIGIIYYNLGDYSRALENYRKSLQIKEALNDKMGVATSLMNIGIIHANRSENNRALRDFKKSLATYETLGNLRGVAQCYGNIASIHWEKKEYSKGLDYYKKSLALGKSLGDRRGQTIANGYIGSMFSELHQYDSAWAYHKTALKLAREIGDKSKESYSLNGLGVIALGQGQYGLANQYASQSLAIAKNIGNVKNIQDASKTLHKAASSIGDYQTAYEAHITYKSATDTLFNEEQTKKLTSLELNYEFEQERDSVAFAREQEKLLYSRQLAKKEFNTRLSYIIVGVCLILGIIIAASRYRITQNNRIKKLQDRISKDLHDEVGSSLSSIALVGTVARASIDTDSKKSADLLDQINANATRTMQSVSDIVWVFNSEKRSFAQLVNRLKTYANEIVDTEKWQIQITCEPNLMDKKLDMIQRRNLHLILKEAISNAVKYSKGDMIEARISSEDKKIKVLIKDNGKGFDIDKIHQKDSLGGNGLANMKTRAKELGGTVTIESIIGTGTQVILTFTA